MTHGVGGDCGERGRDRRGGGKGGGDGWGDGGGERCVFKLLPFRDEMSKKVAR